MPEKYIPAELRRFVAERAGQCCEYCRSQTHYSENCALMLGLTPTGRATIGALQLNRPGLLNLRRVLYAVGEHPPKLEKRS